MASSKPEDGCCSRNSAVQRQWDWFGFVFGRLPSVWATPPPSCSVEDDLGRCQDENDEDSQKTLKLPGFFARFGILTVITMPRSWAIGQADHFYGRSPRHRARQVQGRPRIVWFFNFISVPLRVCFPRKQGQPGTPPPTPRKSRPPPQVEIFERTPSVLDQQLGC